MSTFIRILICNLPSKPGNKISCGLAGWVRPTLEVMLVESPRHLCRRIDPASGLGAPQLLDARSLAQDLVEEGGLDADRAQLQAGDIQHIELIMTKEGLLIFVNGKVSVGHILGGYVGLLSLGAASLAIGMFGSSLAQAILQEPGDTPRAATRVPRTRVGLIAFTP